MGDIRSVARATVVVRSGWEWVAGEGDVELSAPLGSSAAGDQAAGVAVRQSISVRGRAPVLACPPQDAAANENPAADQEEAGGSAGVGSAAVAAGVVVCAGPARTTLLRFGSWRGQEDEQRSEDGQNPPEVSAGLVSISHGRSCQATAGACSLECAPDEWGA